MGFHRSFPITHQHHQRYRSELGTPCLRLRPYHLRHRDGPEMIQDTYASFLLLPLRLFGIQEEFNLMLRVS